MRRRLYFLLPDIASARTTRDDMLLARIEIDHIHFLGQRGALPDDLPEANVLQKTDFVHGAQMGAVIGGLAGTIGGFFFVLFPPEGVSLQLVTVLLAALAGAMFGAWVSSMIGAGVPNTKLKAFHAAIERGQVLLMVDVPMSRVQEIIDLVARRHPEAVSGGFEPTIPAFP